MLPVHGRRLPAAQTHLTLDLIRVVVFPSGVCVHLALTAAGVPAELARYQTRPLTDPDGHSARWSYLTVRAAVLARCTPAGAGGDRHGPVDPDRPGPPTTATATFRIECTEAAFTDLDRPGMGTRFVRQPDGAPISCHQPRPLGGRGRSRLRRRRVDGGMVLPRTTSEAGPTGGTVVSRGHAAQ